MQLRALLDSLLQAIVSSSGLLFLTRRSPVPMNGDRAYPGDDLAGAWVVTGGDCRAELFQCLRVWSYIA